MLKRLLLIIIALLVAFLGAAFSVRNAHIVEFDYYLDKMDLPLSVIMVIALAVGVLLGILSTLSMIIKLKFKSSSYAKKYERLQHNYQEKIDLIKTRDVELKELNARLEKQVSLEYKQD